MAESKTVLREVGGGFVRVHGIITRALQVTNERSASFARTGYPDVRTGEGFTLCVQSLATLLHGHHVTEDDVAFPYFRSVTPKAPFDRISAQHQHMVETIDELEGAAEDATSPTRTSEALKSENAASVRMQDLWLPHVGLEERYVGPEHLASFLDMAERVRVGKMLSLEAQKHLRPLSRMVPFLLYNMTGEDRAIMAKGLLGLVGGLSVRLLWRRNWKAMSPFLLP